MFTICTPILVLDPAAFASQSNSRVVPTPPVGPKPAAAEAIGGQVLPSWGKEVVQAIEHLKSQGEVEVTSGQLVACVRELTGEVLTIFHLSQALGRLGLRLPRRLVKRRHRMVTVYTIAR